jgi:hypothetical protein
MSSQKMSAAEWIRQEEARRGLKIQPMIPSSQLTQSMRPLAQPMISMESQRSGPATIITRGIEESIREQQEGLRRNAFIESSDMRPRRLSDLQTEDWVATSSIKVDISL